MLCLIGATNPANVHHSIASPLRYPPSEIRSNVSRKVSLLTIKGFVYFVVVAPYEQISSFRVGDVRERAA